MTEMAIELKGIARGFRRHEVLKSVDLCVPKGETFAFLGRNGAGKTTTIRMLLGLLQPESGSIRVLGLDPAKDAIEIRRRVGYLAEDQKMFGWMKIGELLKFMKPFYPTWDDALARTYLDRFELPVKQKVKHLSKGQNVRLGLLLALAHKPELVILDDPTLGLDPIMRKEFMRDVVENLQGSGVTVFFSSHLLYEIEPVADQVAILDKGRIVKQSPTEALREDVKQVILAGADYDKLGGVPEALDIRRDGTRVAVTVENVRHATAGLAEKGIRHEVVDLNLDEIFEAYVIGKGGRAHVEEPAVERVA